jgi:hypothetical protein
MALSSKIIGFMGKGRKRKMEWKEKEKWKGQATRAMSLALLDEENERPRGVFTKQI